MKKEPERTCIGCGMKKVKKELIRIVRGEDGTLSLDPGGRKNGRGAYICKNAECLDKAIHRKALNRAFSMEIPDVACEQLKKEFTEIAK